MLVIIKSPPGSVEAQRAVDLAAERAADIVLTGKAAALAIRDALKGFCGTAFVLSTDLARYIPKGSELDKGVKPVTPEELEGMMEKEDWEGPI